jgi:hypothetical protein
MQTLPTMGRAAKIIQKSPFPKKARYSNIAKYFSLKNLNWRRNFGQQATAVILVAGGGGGVHSFPIIGQQLDLRSRLCLSFTFTSGHFNIVLLSSLSFIYIGPSETTLEGLQHRARIPSPLPLRVAKTGRNHLNEEFTPLLPTGIGERF